MNNEDAISRARLKKRAIYLYGFGGYKYVPLRDVENAPTVPPKVAHGRWDIFGCCNQCGYGDEKQSTQYIKENYKYCPNCGAKMGGEDDAAR